MEYGFFNLLKLVGALGFFIYGMKVMSESIQKVAGDQLRTAMNIITTNRFSGIFTGFLITSIIQSSSATTVVIVSFVNAGLLKLKQAICIIMGANIGTTMTAVLIIFFGFSRFNISMYTLPIIAIGFPLIFAKKKIKYWGEFLIGFALLFMGLSALKEAVPDLKHNPEILTWIQNLNNIGFLSIIIMVFVGAILTIVVQSSSAAMAITLVMCENEWIPYELATAIVLGENIGTTITANIAAMVGNVHAKRAARAHFIFNVFGVIWMMTIFHFYLAIIDTITIYMGYGSPLNEISAIKWGLTFFHISFNIINTFVMVWFISLIEKTVKKMVPMKTDDDEFYLKYMETQLLGTPELFLLEAKKEIINFGEITKKMNRFLQELITTDDTKRQTQLIKKIQKYEERTDEMELEIDNHLIKVSEGRLSTSISFEIKGMLSITNDLERVADIILRMSKDVGRIIKFNLEFSKSNLDDFKIIFDAVDAAFNSMITNLNNDYANVTITEARENENKIDRLVKSINKEHLKSIDEKDYDVKTGIVFRDIIFGYERVGDHIVNVTEGVIGDFQKEEEEIKV